MKTKDVAATYSEHVLGTYQQYDVCLVRGKGARVWDLHEKEYLDFFSGWAVSNIGHCHPKVMSAVRDQLGKLIHVPNVYYNVKQATLAKLISSHSFPSKVFFCNSGAEANEAAVKFARRYFDEPQKNEIITLKQSFHGRTLGAMTATAQTKIQKGFEPLPRGFKYAVMNDIESLEKAVTEKTAAILFEPIQGEGGIRIASKSFMKKIRALCNKKKMLMILDEVQTGVGRTGEMFAYQHFGIVPDLMTLAKGLGSGLPIGALVVNQKIKNALTPGTHGSTFGGNPVVCSAAIATLEVIDKQGLLAKTQELGAYFMQQLNELKASYPLIKEVRGIGLMIGVELNGDGKAVVDLAMEKGLLINCTQGNILRIFPVLNSSRREIHQGLDILRDVFKELS